MEKRKIKKTGTPTFQCMNPNAAGVDVGAMESSLMLPGEPQQRGRSKTGLFGTTSGQLRERESS